jgi:hypothetical protein
VSPYNLIDGILSHWAEAHSLVWLTEYQDTEVRTFFLNPNRRDRVQVWVDAPKGENTTIHIGQYQRGLSRLNRVETITASVSSLPSALNKALKTASEWASDMPPIAPKNN